MFLAGAIKISLGNLSRFLMSGNHIRDYIMKFKTHILVFQCCWKFWWCWVEFWIYAGLSPLWAKQKNIFNTKERFLPCASYMELSMGCHQAIEKWEFITMMDLWDLEQSKFSQRSPRISVLKSKRQHHRIGSILE